MSWKDNLKESQGVGSDHPRIDIIMSFKCKSDDSGKPVMKYYDKNSKEDIEFTGKVMGVLLGNAMQIDHYSAELGVKGASYRSDYFWSNDHITLYEPSPKGNKRAVTGTIDEITTFIGEKPKRKMIYFILTDSGIVTVSTSLIIAIDQLKSMKDVIADYIIELVPTKYQKEIKNISGRAKQFLGKLAAKNPPVFADIVQLTPITDEAAAKLNLEEQAKNFTEWKKWKQTVKVDKEDPPAETEPEPAPLSRRQEVIDRGATPEPPEDDLPF